MSNNCWAQSRSKLMQSAEFMLVQVARLMTGTESQSLLATECMITYGLDDTGFHKVKDSRLMLEKSEYT